MASKVEAKGMPPLQVQQKTQFRQCKDFVITDFKPFFKQSSVSDEKTLDEALFNYSNYRFPGLMSSLTPKERRQFLDELALPIFAHRRGKGLSFLARFD